MDNIDPTKWRWGHEYDELRQAGYSWRVAAYIAWASSPAANRNPPTQKELATQVLGLKSANVIGRWKKKDPTIAETIFKMQAGPLMRYRRDAFDALVSSAVNDEANRSSDRRLFFTMTGDLVEASKVETSGETNVNVKTYQTVSPEDWDEPEDEQSAPDDDGGLL